MHRIVQFVESLDENLEYFDHKIIADEIVIRAKFKRRQIYCPRCGFIARRYHGVYERSCQDLSLLGKKSRIVISIRKMHCSNSECSHTTFAEPCNFLPCRGKQTKRLLAEMERMTKKESL